MVLKVTLLLHLGFDMIASANKALSTTVWLEIRAEYPWRVRAYNKPLWLALIMHPFHIRYKRGVIYIKERLT